MTECLTMLVDYHKLVCDQIPEIIEASGTRAVTRILSKDEHLPALLSKLAEEAAEAGVATVEDLPAELAECPRIAHCAGCRTRPELVQSAGAGDREARPGRRPRTCDFLE